MKHRITAVFLLSLVTMVVTACGSGDSDGKSGINSGETAETNLCLATLSNRATTPQAAINDCEAACKDGDGSRAACGAMALGHLQALVEEIGTYAGFLKPSQTPQETFTTLKAEIDRRYDPSIDVRTFINQFLGSIFRALEGIRTGVLYSVGDGSTVVRISELPLDPAVLAIIYGDAESFSLVGEWTEEELSALGAFANLLLSVVDLVMAHNLDIDISQEVPDFDGIADVISFAIEVLNDQPKLLVVDAPESVMKARHETHAFMSLLAGREDDLENVSMATLGFLGYVEESFANQKAGQTTMDDKSFVKMRDVDGDETLSRGDNIVFIFNINGEEVTFGAVYPISAVLTQEIFQLLGAVNANLDGSGVPARISPLYNSIIREFGVLASVAQAGGFSLNYMPDVLAFDHDTFFDQFTGLRGLLPFWYEDPTLEGANEYYFSGVTPGTGVKFYMAFETEPTNDTSHFDWADQVTWFETSSTPAAMAADGLAPEPGYYILWQDPTFAGFVNVHTDPFLTGNYGMASDLSTSGEFIAPRDNRMTNAVTNAFILWFTE